MKRPAHTKHTERFVAYYRVSTARQGKSGLGLDAQREIVSQFIKYNGNRIIAEYVEVESGRKDKRPELEKAIQTCKSQDACLVVAKLDRLSRSLSFILKLQEAEIKFVCCDLPQANEFTIHIIAAVAQWEAGLIRTRLKDAFAAKREREPDWKGGTDNLTDAGRQKAYESLRQNGRTNTEHRRAYDFIKRRRDKGMSWQKIADAINKTNLHSIKRAKGGKFTFGMVQYIYNKFSNQQEP